MRLREGSAPPAGAVYVNRPLAMSTSVTYTNPATFWFRISVCVDPWLTASTA